MNNIAELAISDLLAFDAIFTHRSVSEAARSLDVPQPTLSRRLAKLRESFNDPLFVRTREGMLPTPVGLSMVEAVQEIARIYQERLLHSGSFDAASSTRTFKIVASDFGQLLVLSALERWAEKTAPRVRFVAVPLDHRPLIERLESGEVDLAVGGFPNLFAGVLEQALLEEHYACIVRTDHPRIGLEISLEEYKNANHIVVSSHLLGHIHQEVERRILEICTPDRVRIITESFLLGALLVEQTDLILTVPVHVVELLNMRSGLLRLLKPPIELPGFSVKQYWHERYHRDPGNEWLRRSIMSIFSAR